MDVRPIPAVSMHDLLHVRLLHRQLLTFHDDIWQKDITSKIVNQAQKRRMVAQHRLNSNNLLFYHLLQQKKRAKTR